MIPDVLKRCIQGDRREGGCGMSLRPEYTSGRGVVYDDLCAEFLVRMYTCIENNSTAFPRGAADGFCRMVRDTEVLSATDFLNNLFLLAGRSFQWEAGKVKAKGWDLAADDESDARLGSALGTLVEALSKPRDPEGDVAASDAMRDEFFRCIGRTDLMKDLPRRVQIDGTFGACDYNADCSPPKRSRRRSL